MTDAPQTDDEREREIIRQRNAARTELAERTRERDDYRSDYLRVHKDKCDALDREHALRAQLATATAVVEAARKIRSNIFYWMTRNHHRGERSYSMLGQVKEQLTEAVKTFDDAQQPEPSQEVMPHSETHLAGADNTQPPPLGEGERAQVRYMRMRNVTEEERLRSGGPSPGDATGERPIVNSPARGNVPVAPPDDLTAEQYARLAYQTIETFGWQVSWNHKKQVPDDAWPIDVLQRHIECYAADARAARTREIVAMLCQPPSDVLNAAADDMRRNVDPLQKRAAMLLEGVADAIERKFGGMSDENN